MKDALMRRRRMMQHGAIFSGGIMGRTPDYLSSDVMALASTSRFFDQNDPRFGDNVRRSYE